MVGIVDDDVRNQITSSIKAIMDRDADLLVDSLTDLGALTPSASRDKFSRDIKRIMSHYPTAIEDLNLEVNLSELFSVVRRNHVVLPSNTFLLLKTMMMVQSMGKELDPQFDFFSVVAPEVEDLLQKRYMPSAMIRRLPSIAAELAIFGMGLPRRLLKIIKGVERGELQVRTDVSGVELHLVHLERIVNRLLIGLVIAFIILAAAIAFLAFRLG